MKTPAIRKASWPYRALILVALLALVMGLFARIYHLGFPDTRMWDEVYFPKYAYDYLTGKNFFDLHPPLGKFIIAVGIIILGNDPLGWRIMPDLFGVAMIFLGAFAGWYFLKERVAAILLCSFIAADTMMIVYSRSGLMDGMLMFFVLATVLASWRVERKEQVVWVAALFGLTVAIKWAAAPVVIPAAYILWRKGYLRPFIGSLYLSVLIYLLIVYAGQIINHTSNPWQAWKDVWLWHLKALHQITRAVPNTEASEWWGWPLMTRPILFFWNKPSAPGESVRTVLALGNPVIWWSSTAAVLFGFYDVARRKLVLKQPIADHPLVPVLLGWAFLILPWVPGTRIPFVYNYFPAYAFALLALVYWLREIWNLRPWLVVFFSACALACGLFFLPMAMGLPMSAQSLNDHIWLLSWNHPEYNKAFEINHMAHF